MHVKDNAYTDIEKIGEKLAFHSWVQEVEKRDLCLKIQSSHFNS